MSYANGKITAPVSIYDVQQALGTSHTDIGSLCRSEKINPWAMWKPVAVYAGRDYNSPQRLSYAQVRAMNYGSKIAFDTWGNDVSGQLETLANSGILQNWGGVCCIPFNHLNNQFHRLTDFVAPSDAPALEMGGGYDHHAQPTGVRIEVGSAPTVYELKPLIPEGSRDMDIADDSTAYKFEFPRDFEWLNKYYNPDEDTEIIRHEGWLHPLDLFTANIYGEVFTSSPRRGVAILKWMEYQSVYQWVALGWVYDTDTQETPPREQAGAFLDLSRSNRNTLSFTGSEGQEVIGDMQGRYLFVDMYLGMSSTSENYPIPGFCYEVNITRHATSQWADLNYNENPWEFEFQQVGDLLYLYVTKKSGTSGYSYGSVFSSLNVVITADNKGTETALYTWDLLNFIQDDHGAYDEDNYHRTYYLDLSMLGSNVVMDKYSVAVGVQSGTRRTLSSKLTAY